MKINKDCFHFNGYKPCKPHKEHGVHCEDCKYYQKLSKNILIIKLQAAGEVIRNSPLIHRLNKEYPNSRIYWLTKYPELVPTEHVYKVLPWDGNAILFLQDQHFDLVCCLDKDIEACSLANLINADVKKGFSQKNGVIEPFDEHSKHKWITGLFDDEMKNNTKNYVEELYEIFGFKWEGEKYILPKYIIPKINFTPKKKVIGISTGVGAKWPTRKFSESKLISLIDELKNNYEIILLGGPLEDELNKRVSEKTNVNYFGTFPLLEFMGLMSYCDLIITPVTLSLHIAIGLEKKIILLNNIFPTNEFHIYGLGKILEPDIPCKYCYKSKFDDDCHSEFCMDVIDNQTIINEIENLLQ